MNSKRPIHVLFVNTRSAIGADVGVHLSLIRNFDPGECQATVATNRRARDHAAMLQALAEAPGVGLVSLDLGQELVSVRGSRRLATAAANSGALLVALARLAWLVLTRHVDVIHSTDRPRDALLATLLSKLTGRPNLIHMHIKWTGAGMGRATNWGVRNCGGVLAISDFVARSLTDRGVPAHKVFTALNATDAGQYNPQSVTRGSLRRRLGVDDNTPIIGVVGRIMVWKGQLDLIEALPIVRESFPNARLAIAGLEDRVTGGGGSYAEQIRARAAELGVSDAVVFAGWFDNSAEAFADMDVVCVPSVEEPFGLVVTEAMAMERPVVGYDSGALPEIIESGREGLLVPPRDAKSLGEAIVRLLSDADCRRDMGRHGRERVIARFGPQRQAAEVTEVYRALRQVGRRRNPAAEAGAESAK